MNNLLLTTFLLATGLAVLLGAVTGSAMAFSGYVDSYNYSEIKKDGSYEESEDYEFDNMHKMFKDCFEYHHNFGEYGYKDKDKMSDYSHDNYNRTDDDDDRYDDDRYDDDRYDDDRYDDDRYDDDRYDDDRYDDDRYDDDRYDDDRYDDDRYDDDRYDDDRYDDDRYDDDRYDDDRYDDDRYDDDRYDDDRYDDCYGMMSFMKEHMMMFDMPFMGGHDMMMFDMPFMGGHATPGTITVAGTATASVEPERVVITMGVETVRPTASAALAENSELLDMAVNSVVSLGIPIDDIATSRITIYPEYDSYYDVDGQHRQTFAGYNVRNIIMVNTDQINMTAAILDTAVQAGINNVESVQFTVSDDTKIRIQESLIEAAVLNAKHQAHLALKPLKHTIIGVEDVTIEPSSGVPLERLSANLFDAFASIATPIFTPDEDLSATVLVTFLIGPDYYEYKE